jgi:hypothetical protein
MRPLLLAGVLLLSTLPAQAQTRVDCGVINGMDYCLTDTVDEDIVLIIGPEGGERITIDCVTRKWKANGPNTQEFVQNTVNLYCSNSTN